MPRSSRFRQLFRRQSKQVHQEYDVVSLQIPIPDKYHLLQVVEQQALIKLFEVLCRKSLRGELRTRMPANAYSMNTILETMEFQSGLARVDFVRWWLTVVYDHPAELAQVASVAKSAGRLLPEEFIAIDILSIRSLRREDAQAEQDAEDEREEFIRQAREEEQQ